MTRALCSMVLVLCGCEFRGTSFIGTTDADDHSDAPAEAPPPWLGGWTHRKRITLHASQIEAPNKASLVDFPVELAFVDAEITDVARAGGADLAFTGADATTQLASEIEAFSTLTHDVVAWVKVPVLPATTDTTLYVYYGNSTASPPAPELVWTASFLGVWHMQQDPSPDAPDMLDSTAGNRDGVPHPNMAASNLVPARPGNGILFDGVEDFINFGPVDVGSSFTISMWARYGGRNSCNTMFANSDSGRDTAGFRFFVNSVNTTNRRLIFEAGNGAGGSGQIAETADGAVPVNELAHLAVVVDRVAATARLFVNAQPVATDMSIMNTFETNSDFELGRTENGFQFFDGVLDQVEVATEQRSREWLVTAFNNQSQPSAFHTFGPVELVRE